MRPAPKRHVALTSIPAIITRPASGNRRIRRETPLVVPAAVDLELCRTGTDTPPNSRQQPKANARAERDDAELQASLRSAYRPKPASGGGYSVVISEAVGEGQPPPTRQRRRRD